MANPYRGEIALKLGRVDLTMRPTWEAMVAIEEVTGKGIVALIRKGAAKDLSLGEITDIVVHGARAAGHPAKREEIGGLIVKAGLLAVIQPVNEFLVSALRGGEEPGEAKAAGADPT